MSRAKNEDRFDPDERVRGDAYAVPRRTRRRKLWMLVYPRRKRTLAKSDMVRLPIDVLASHLLMTTREMKKVLRELKPRDRRGLRIVEVPL